jgi:hypothetical protein
MPCQHRGPVATVETEPIAQQFQRTYSARSSGRIAMRLHSCPATLLATAGLAMLLATFAGGWGGIDAASAPHAPGSQPATLQQSGPRRTVDAIKADLDTVLAQGYDPFQVQVNQGAPGGTLIAISGTLSQSADGYNQWVFFFLGAEYLGTDTASPSFGLQITGNAGPGAISVQYVAYGPNDPLCCPTLPPVVITYTWDGRSLLPNGTPPGH